MIHPAFTEVGPIIGEYGAGWLVESGSSEEVAAVLTGILSDRSEIEVRAENARAAWRHVFEPRVATRPLVDLIRRIWS